MRWRVDSRQARFYADGTSLIDLNLYLVNFDGDTPLPAIHVSGPLGDGPAATPDLFDAYPWSPDGRWLAFSRDVAPNTVRSLYVVPVDLGDPPAPLLITASEDRSGPPGGIDGRSTSSPFARGWPWIAYLTDDSLEKHLYATNVETGAAPILLSSSHDPQANWAWAP